MAPGRRFIAFTVPLMVACLGIAALLMIHPAVPSGGDRFASVDSSPAGESCLACHAGMTGFSASHNPGEIGCSACHLGDPLASEKTEAHSGMILIPGNLADAPMTCGTLDCHPGIDARVANSLMNTMSGVVAVDRYVLGEIDSPDGFHDIRDLGDSAADSHLRNLCASCHLGQPKEETGPITELSRGGGCNACHLNYDDAALAARAGTRLSRKENPPAVHPSLSLKVTDDHCFGCHSRSGRISTNYEGWHETGLRPDEIAGRPDYRVLEDDRVFTTMQDDVHHARGLACIDCHGSYEVMGSGRVAHEEEAVQTTCADCHTDGKPRTASYDQLDPESRAIVTLRNIDPRKRFVIGQKSDRPMINVFLNDRDQLIFQSKLKGTQTLLTPPGPDCPRGGAHEEVSCSACHSSWAPQCISCHTAFDPDEEGYDLLDRKPTRGAWIEDGGRFMADTPALGVVENGAIREIKPFIPGMVMTFDRSGYSGLPDDQIHRRLYAPASPHTIAAKGRVCTDCHNNPVALGYGRGDLTYVIEGKTGTWSFQPELPPWEPDGLPLDAWIAFSPDGSRKNPERATTTRSNARPLSRSEQNRILRVGACLTCHAADSQVARSMLTDFGKALAGRSDDCQGQ